MLYSGTRGSGTALPHQQKQQHQVMDPLHHHAPMSGPVGTPCPLYSGTCGSCTALPHPIYLYPHVMQQQTNRTCPYHAPVVGSEGTPWPLYSSRHCIFDPEQHQENSTSNKCACRTCQRPSWHTMPTVQRDWWQRHCFAPPYLHLHVVQHQAIKRLQSGFSISTRLQQPTVKAEYIERDIKKVTSTLSLADYNRHALQHAQR
jgi:hypothetical protein